MRRFSETALFKLSPIRDLIDFWRLFAWFSLRHIRQHLGRAGTVLLGIALGAAVFTCVRISVDASLQSFTNSMTAFTGQAEQVIFRPGGYLDETIIETLLSHPLVAGASPVLTTYVRRAQEGEDAFLLIGIDPLLDRSFRHWRAAAQNQHTAAVWLDLIRRPRTIVLGKPLAQIFGIGPGTRWSLSTPAAGRHLLCWTFSNPAGLPWPMAVA